MNENEMEKLWGAEWKLDSFDGMTITEIENALFVMYPDLPDDEIYRLANETFQYGR